MAAVTIEDCLEIIPNRFELVLIASARVRQLVNGAPVLCSPEREPEKSTIIALREIGANLVDVEKIREEVKNDIVTQSLFRSSNDEIVHSDKKTDDDDAPNFSSSADISEIISEELNLNDMDVEVDGDINEDEDDSDEYDSYDDDLLEDDSSDE